MNQAPEAIFVVERRPGQGYGITSAFGPRAQALQRAAVEVLDQLGQPDPRGPEEIQRWVPAAGPDRQPLFVRIRRTPDGESVYHQAWFPPTPPAPRVAPRLLPWGLGALVLLLAGGVLGWVGHGTLVTPVPPPAPEGVSPPVVRADPVPGSGGTPSPAQADAALHLTVRRAREVRKKLADFLLQPGLTGWPDEAGTVEPTIELRDFRKTPRGLKIEPIYLRSDEARSLRQLLEALDNLP